MSILRLSVVVLVGLTLLGGRVSAAEDSRADEMLSRDVTHRLHQIESGLRLGGEPGIGFFGVAKVVRKEILRQPDATGAWIEGWTVQRKGYVVTYAIRFSPSDRGGTDVSFLPPAWRNDTALDLEDGLSPTEASAARWIAGVVARTPGVQGKYRVTAVKGRVNVTFAMEVTAKESAVVGKNLKEMQDQLKDFYGAAPAIAFKFNHAAFGATPDP